MHRKVVVPVLGESSCPHFRHSAVILGSAETVDSSLVDKLQFVIPRLKTSVLPRASHCEIPVWSRGVQTTNVSQIHEHESSSILGIQSRLMVDAFTSAIPIALPHKVHCSPNLVKSSPTVIDRVVSPPLNRKLCRLSPTIIEHYNSLLHCETFRSNPTIIYAERTSMSEIIRSSPTIIDPLPDIVSLSEVVRSSPTVIDHVPSPPLVECETLPLLVDAETQTVLLSPLLSESSPEFIDEAKTLAEYLMKNSFKTELIEELRNERRNCCDLIQQECLEICIQSDVDGIDDQIVRYEKGVVDEVFDVDEEVEKVFDVDEVDKVFDEYEKEVDVDEEVDKVFDDYEKEVDVDEEVDKVFDGYEKEVDVDEVDRPQNENDKTKNDNASAFSTFLAITALIKFQRRIRKRYAEQQEALKNSLGLF